GGARQSVVSAGTLPASNVSRSRGDGARNASIPRLLGSAANRFRAHSQACRASSLRVGGLSLLGARRGHRPDESPPPARDLEALGASRTDGALAAGLGARVRAR